MRIPVLVVGCMLSLTPIAFAAPRLDEPVVSASPEQFQVAQKTEVPNTTLQPGSYSIRIVDHLRDRVILQVSGKSNHVEATFIAIPASTMANAPAGPILYGASPKGKSALKGFAFPGGLALEFVYPKNDAVSIAKANGTRVMAIDPASEGRVPSPKLSQNDMQMITLWMLEPSRVGPNDPTPTIAAAKYQAPPEKASEPVQTAQATPAPAAAPSQSYPAAQSNPSPAPRPVRRSQPAQLAQNDTPPPPPARSHTRPAGVTALPHTASDLPLFSLAALLSLLTASMLTVRRLATRS